MLVGGTLVGGAWYATSHDLTAGLFDSLAGQGTRVAQAVPHFPAGPTPTIVPGIAQYPAPVPKPAQVTGRRLSGEVTRVSADPAAFTIRTSDGNEMTFEVLNTTVFLAGRDRPYRFDLLKAGDQVTVRDGPDRVPVPNVSPVPSGGNAKATTVHTSIGPRPPAGESIARQVMVRPAGETRKASGKGRQAQLQDGGNNGTGQ
jgi:hypothetical protein